jgi:hypothetical protein
MIQLNDLTATFSALTGIGLFLAIQIFIVNRSVRNV